MHQLEYEEYVRRMILEISNAESEFANDGDAEKMMTFYINYLVIGLLTDFNNPRILTIDEFKTLNEVC